MGFDMLPHMTANPHQKLLYLLFPMSGKPRLRRAALLVAGVHQTCSRLTMYELYAAVDANAVGSQANQDQSDKEVPTEKGTQRLNITAVGDIFIDNWERGQDQVCPRRAPEKCRSHW
jgi:hypothetical protein